MRSKPMWRDPSLLILVVLAVCVWLLFAAGWSPAAEASLADCIEATCRIKLPDGGTGTGCAFERKDGLVYVLTNAHVVGDNREVTCVFWHAGHESRPVTGQVLARAAEGIDAAIVTVPESRFGQFPPKIIPLAKRGYQLQEGQTITSVGCANGGWSTGWKGHAVGPANFVPVPAIGRSGSALFDARAEKIVGLIWGQQKEEGRGYAVTVAQIYQGFSAWANGRGTSNVRRVVDDGGWRAVANTASPPACGPDGCPESTQLLPWRRLNNQRLGQLQQQQPPINIYPSLPPYQPAPQPAPAPAPSVDFSGVNARLDRIAQLLETFAAAGAGARRQVLPEPEARDQEATRRALDSAAAETAKAIAQSKADTKEAVAEVQSTQSKLLSAVNRLVGDRET
ncbi:MAG: S1 family peptidase, partial [Planctomycetota bacterium]